MCDALNQTKAEAQEQEQAPRPSAIARIKVNFSLSTQNTYEHPKSDLSGRCLADINLVLEQGDALPG